MINQSNICVLDFETTGLDPHTCDPTQLAALIIDPRTLDILGEWHSLCKPNMALVTAEVLEKTHLTTEALEAAPEQSIMWEGFSQWYKNYITYTDNKKNYPIIAGHNIAGYDLHILDRLINKYETGRFRSMFFIDTMQQFFMWFENSNALPGYKQDQILEHIGLSNKQSHNAVEDVRANAQIVIKLLKLHRNLFRKVIWNESVGDSSN